MSFQNRPGSKELRHRAAEEVVIGRGTPYQVTEKDLEDLEGFPQNHSGHFVSEMQATRDIQDHNVEEESSPNEIAAIARVRAALSIDDWHPDVAIKAFHDLDLIFFDGHLRGNVCVCWSDSRINYRFIPGTSEDPIYTTDVIAKGMASGLHKFEHTVRQLPSGQKEVIVRSEGVTCWIGYPAGQCRIMLNADSVLGEGESPWQKMWAFLLHEMCHAYDRVRTNENDGHGKHFGTRLDVVFGRWNELFGVHGVVFNRSIFDRFHSSELTLGIDEKTRVRT